MSTIKIPTHVVVLPGKVVTALAWKPRTYGKPNVDNLIKFVAKLDESFAGSNAHMAEDFPGGVRGIVKIVEQKTHYVVASYCA